MNIKRSGALVGLFAMSAFGLVACSDSDGGGDNGTASAQVDTECGGASNIRASGATSQLNAMNTFSLSYEDSCDGQTVDYTGNGSGAGISEFSDGLTAFGGSDSPLKEEQVQTVTERCEGNAPLHVPLVFGPIAVATNVEGVEQVTFSPEVLAKVMNGEIAKWNDAEIAELNGDAELPDADIVVFHRSDDSGTTENFQTYLETAAPAEWTQGVGKDFRGAGEGRQGSEGVANAVRDTANSITYTEWSFAKNNNLGVSKITTPADEEGVELSAETAGTSIDSARIADSDNEHDIVIETESFYVPEAAGAYPIIMPTYEIVCSTYPDAEEGEAVKSFLRVSASEDVQAELEDGGYIPIPDEFRDRLNASIDSIN